MSHEDALDDDSILDSEPQLAAEEHYHHRTPYESFESSQRMMHRRFDRLEAKVDELIRLVREQTRPLDTMEAHVHRVESFYLPPESLLDKSCTSWVAVQKSEFFGCQNAVDVASNPPVTATFDMNP